ncbi:Glycosyltransferase involved in cell wall bisynthesis [Tangfeifania diversioriginum]|uniref:Glycosyltransferase involved in cell wall bisynthesis n=1 Tax=Tangfeifania diversioriginum TaxID=1168035 RepID=A0A1M6LZG8_9BACT|nr:glycosyltransferase [Tangfeifania diversioriginum]SHJ76575.1 Glycosyltransferase involved in cell wall bisynthesis [Tangfeifania diversioriginum]
MKLAARKRIIVSVTNDLVSDNRVHKTCSTLADMGFNVLLAGRKLHHSPKLTPRSYSTRRFKLLFNKGPLFYACYNFRLFWILIFRKFDLLLANDLDTLPANYLAAKIKKKPLVYDSHEYFTEVPELVNRTTVQRIWEGLEKQLVPKVNAAYTVCDSIARIYTEKYGVDFRVVRNVPAKQNFNPGDDNTSENHEKIILYQGAVNIGRGLEQAILAMKYLQGAKLLIAGDGDIITELQQLTEREGLQNKVQFLGRLPIDELAQLTPQAHLGLSIEEDLGLNYRYALPNKLFDYIRARVPVLVTDLPEMATLVKHYQIGETIHALEPKLLAEKMEEMLENQAKQAEWKQNLETAARELNWENEKGILVKIFQPFL